MGFTLLPKSLQNFSSFEISSLEILLSADNIHHRFSNSSANPACGPLNSVPAGTEFSGPQAGFAELFENRWCILSADKSISKDEISKLEKFWSDLGSKVKLMSFEQHDYVLSLTSHLPHAVAYSIVKTAINDDDKFKNDIIQYSAGGLRDFTRIAASDPLMWRDIFIDNSENILKVLNDYSNNLDEIKTAIENKDGEKLMKIFSSTKKVRKEIIKAGQDTEKPGFGRK